MKDIQQWTIHRVNLTVATGDALDNRNKATRKFNALGAGVQFSLRAYMTKERAALGLGDEDWIDPGWLCAKSHPRVLALLKWDFKTLVVVEAFTTTQGVPHQALRVKANDLRLMIRSFDIFPRPQIGESHIPIDHGALFDIRVHLGFFTGADRPAHFGDRNRARIENWGHSLRLGKVRRGRKNLRFAFHVSLNTRELCVQFHRINAGALKHAAKNGRAATAFLSTATPAQLQTQRVVANDAGRDNVCMVDEHGHAADGAVGDGVVANGVLGAGVNFIPDSQLLPPADGAALAAALAAVNGAVHDADGAIPRKVRILFLKSQHCLPIQD